MPCHVVLSLAGLTMLSARTTNAGAAVQPIYLGKLGKVKQSATVVAVRGSSEDAVSFLRVHGLASEGIAERQPTSGERRESV
jgi:hypothetical protein